MWQKRYESFPFFFFFFRYAMLSSVKCHGTSQVSHFNSAERCGQRSQGGCAQAHPKAGSTGNREMKSEEASEGS